MKITLARASLASLLISTIAAAQPPSVEDMEALRRAYRKYEITVDGGRDPAQIPYAVVMESTFGSLAEEHRQDTDKFSENVRARFVVNDADLESITSLAATHDGFIAAVSNQESRSVDKACADFLASEAEQPSASSVAMMFEQVKAERMRAIESHYRDAINQLTPATRYAFLEYADTNMRPSIKWGTFDNIGFANEAPAAFLWNRRLSCERWARKPVEEKTWHRDSRAQTVDVDADTPGDSVRNQGRLR
jgi:hypothetical protein